jgi:hypothetical protein
MSVWLLPEVTSRTIGRVETYCPEVILRELGFSLGIVHWVGIPVDFWCARSDEWGLLQILNQSVEDVDHFHVESLFSDLHVPRNRCQSLKRWICTTRSSIPLRKPAEIQQSYVLAHCP